GSDAAATRQRRGSDAAATRQRRGSDAAATRQRRGSLQLVNAEQPATPTIRMIVLLDISTSIQIGHGVVTFALAVEK
ncbi:hypothetical protein, partial [Streptomyces sp. NPDC048611]|uniref:hypothetical protein n=1 Tax=Streptomyces sp. NPDC048611 TaxID=3155635 RepID=UPI003448CE3B